MSLQMVLLPVFLLVALAFILQFGMAKNRMTSMNSGEVTHKDVALGQARWPNAAATFGDCFRNQFEIPVLFYALIAIGLPLRKIDLVLVVLSWVFVVTRYVHAGIFITSNNIKHRGGAWFLGSLVLMAMWLYFAFGILLV